jgi:hypothetical protein
LRFFIVLKEKTHMKNLILIFTFVLLSVSVSAQDAKKASSARPSEQKEISADNHLKRTIQQKQLSSAPERIADTASQTETRKDVKRKKRSCGTKCRSKA